MKIKNLLTVVALTTIYFLLSCNKENSSTEIPTEAPLLTVPAKKALTGSFIDFWGKGDWSQAHWESQFQEMKDIGMNTAIIQFTAFEEYTWFNSANTFANTKFPNALSRLLTAAVKKQMEVYIGLYFSNEYWQHQTDIAWLTLHADRCKQIAAEIQAQFGSKTAFKGWYIPHEPEPYAYNSPALVASFRDNFVNRISNYLHTLNSKPVAIAAFFNSQLTTSNQLLYFMKELGKCNLQVIMLQDGVGVNHVSLADLQQYYNDADWGLYNEGSGYTGQFWTDLETFQTPQAPASIDRIKTQLEIELAMPHITKAVSFQYYSDMCPGGGFGTAAAKLRTDYLAFLGSLK